MENEEIQVQRIESKIFLIRGEKVLLDRDLAELYGVETKQLKRAVRRNIDRFPDDFMFELSKEEFQNLRNQIGTSSWGGTRYSPMAFTEQGVAMLSSVLNSSQAIEVNIQIMRVFVSMRKWAENYTELLQKIESLEESSRDHSEAIIYLYDQIKYLIKEDDRSKKQIGFNSE